MGHVLTVPFAWVDPWPDGLHQLRTAGFALLALTPSAGAVLSSSPAPVAVLLGTEATGLSVEARLLADHCVRIPMAPGVDSLNVATAAAIAFFVVTSRTDSAPTDSGRS